MRFANRVDVAGHPVSGSCTAVDADARWYALLGGHWALRGVTVG
jgi:hypothetical protein